MAEIQKPSGSNLIWADQGDKIKPEDSKILNGWDAEIPPRQFFNYIDWKQDAFIAHVNQHGIVAWDSVTEYQANKSYVQGSDGVVYKAVQTATSVDPVADTAGTYWTEAFASFSSSQSRQNFIGYEVRSADFIATPNTRIYISSPLTVTLPTTAAIGATVTMVKSPTIEALVVVTTGTIITSIGSDTSVQFDINDEINFVFNGTNWEV